MSDLFKLLDETPTALIADAFVIMSSKLNNPNYNVIVCSISGGSDSDILLDIVTKFDDNKKVRYVFFNTGLEYQATKDHLKYLEQKYNIEIEVINAALPIPTCNKKYGQPFLSKQVSEWIARLQRHNFKWEDKPFDELLEEYPKCKAALRWWCNEWEKGKEGQESKFNIAYNKYLKEFMIANPPTFQISNKCCYYAKKLPVHNFKVDNNCDLSINGVRKAEGGARSTAYKNCFTSGEIKGIWDEYRGIFWLKEADKRAYEQAFNICHSRCYSEYGLTRTGCAGCPFGRDFEQELEIIKEYEPKLYKAVNNIFGDSYEYTRKYKKFVELAKTRLRQYGAEV